MKRLRCILTACAIVTANNIIWAGTPNTNEVLNVVLDLSDGSRLIGTPGFATVPVQTTYAKMEIPLTQIQTLKIGDDHETVILNLRNGDTLTGVISLKPIELKTVFGTASIGIEHIQQLRVTLGGRSNGSKWSVRNDFSKTSNPSGPWSYGWTPDGNPAFTRYASMIHKPGIAGWQAAQDAQNAWINHSDETMYGVRTGEVSIHPGPNGEHCVVRWQAPRSCTIIVKGTFGSGDAGAMTVRVRHNATQLFLASDTSKDEPFLFELKVQQDDTVDFDVGCGRGGWGGGTTPIDAEIVVK
jgi:hypothetical protein